MLGEYKLVVFSKFLLEIKFKVEENGAVSYEEPSILY